MAKPNHTTNFTSLGKPPLLERRTVFVSSEGWSYLMTVFEFDQVQRQTPDRPLWAFPVPGWARGLPPVHTLQTLPSGSPVGINDDSDYEEQMLHLLGLK